LSEYEDFHEWHYEHRLEAGFSDEDVQDYSTPATPTRDARMDGPATAEQMIPVSLFKDLADKRFTRRTVYSGASNRDLLTRRRSTSLAHAPSVYACATESLASVFHAAYADRGGR
jgi:hypothetical protein